MTYRKAPPLKWQATVVSQRYVCENFRSGVQGFTETS